MIGGYMDNNKEAFWRRKGYKIGALYAIRFVETILASMIPSIISVFVILLSKDPNSRSWKIFQFGSFLIFYLLNCFFWIRFKLARRKRFEYYWVNCSIYAIYAVLTYIAFRFSDDVIFCSLTFAPLRGFEGFKLKTKASIFLIHKIVAVSIVLCDLGTDIFLKIYSLLHPPEKEDMVSMPSETAVPIQHDKKVEFLSVEEMDSYILREQAEQEKAAKKAAETMPDGVLSNKFSKGSGEDVVFAVPDNPENDFDENDDVPQNHSANDSLMYSPDSLWNKSIYDGRTKDGKPILDYAEDDLKPDFSKDETDIGLIYPQMQTDVPENDSVAEASADKNANMPYSPERLWDDSFRKGRKITAANEPTDISDESSEDMQETDNPENDFDSSHLWGNITQGKNGDTAETVSDEDNDILNYDADNLWGNITKGSKPHGNLPDYAPDTDINPYDQYDSDSLWSTEIYQGKKDK